MAVPRFTYKSPTSFYKKTKCRIKKGSYDLNPSEQTKRILMMDDGWGEETISPILILKMRIT